MRSSSVTLLILASSLMTLLVLAALPVQRAFAHGVVDQVNDNTAGVDAGLERVGGVQSFTPTADNICAVDLFLVSGIPATHPLILVEIRDGTTILGAGVITFGSVTSTDVNTPDVVHVDFPTTIPMPPGTYDLSFFTDEPVYWVADGDNPYSGGQSFESPENDFLFRTYSCPTVVGGEILDVNATSMFMAGALANSGWLITIGGLSAAGVAVYILKRAK